MEIFFVTTNKSKFLEVAKILKNYPLTLKHLPQEYEENQDDSLSEIACQAAQKLANQKKKSIVVEDSGIFFEAFPGFPGALTKFIFKTLGYHGIFKLLKNENPQAYFMTVAAFAQPGQEPILFIGKLKGTITGKVFGPELPDMPYDRIFIPANYNKTIAEMSLDEKNNLSQRGLAFRRFGDYIKKNFLVKKS